MTEYEHQMFVFASEFEGGISRIVWTYGVSDREPAVPFQASAHGNLPGGSSGIFIRLVVLRLYGREHIDEVFGLG